jgi:hypothetical protein
MAVVWGPTASGTTGSMDEDDIIAFLYAKSKWNKTPADTKAFKNAANYMLGHTGKGGGTVHHFDGKMVYHCTENHGEATIFFTNSSGNLVSIVGVGTHSGKKKDNATYTLSWHSKSWKPNKSVGPKMTVPVNQISL